MNDFTIVSTKIKAILSQSIKGKVYDKDVASALGIKPSRFATLKKRNTLPYKEILDYCVANHFNANDLLFSKPVNNVVEAPITIKYLGDLQASAGGGADGLNEDYEELTLTDLLSRFLSRLN